MIRGIIQDFKKYSWDSHPMERTLEMVIASPQSAVELLRLSLDELSQTGFTFLHAAMCLMPEEGYTDLVPTAIQKFRFNRKNKLAEDIVHYCSLQSVRTLHPYLTDLFELEMNKRSYFAPWPWRESEMQHFPYLQDILTGDPSNEKRNRVWRAMLETRGPNVLQYIVDQAFESGMQEDLNNELLRVDFEFTGLGINKLYTDKVYHIFFPNNYLPIVEAPLIRWQNLIRQHHPTWVLKNDSALQMRFGGLTNGTCAYCGEELHHFITLDPIRDALNVTGLNRLELASCLSCLGWGAPQFFYKHDPTGHPHQIGYDGPHNEPEFPAVAFNPTLVRVAQISPRWQWQNDAASNGRENLNRIGGAPSWIQHAEFPHCPGCGQRMKFLLQITSGLPTVDGGQWDWGDGGICYCFWCDSCKISGFLWQCY